MTHVTTLWAERYRLPDPAGPADEVRRAGGSDLRPAIARLTGVGLAAGGAADRAADAGGALRQGWSTPQAERAVAALRTSGNDIAATARAAAQVVTDLAVALESAGTDLDAAYARADAVIGSALLTREVLPTNLPEVAALTAQRSAVVLRLVSELGAVVDRLRQAGAAATHALATDPRDLLPPGTPPVDARSGAGDVDRTNRAALAADRHSADPRRVLFAQAIGRALDEAQAGGRPARLLLYDPDDNGPQGGAAISVGDIARADAVAVLVPGVANSPMDMAGAVHAAAGLAAATERSDPSGSHSAAVAWFGYDIPLSSPRDLPPAGPASAVAGVVQDSVLALDATAAAVGGLRLARFTQGVRAMISESAGLTLIGHSYGSIVVSQAARTLPPSAGVDDIVLLGSPGAGFRVDGAQDYRAVPADHVYTLAFPADPVPRGVTDLLAELANPLGWISRALVFGGSGPFGPDPNAPAFGAQSITTPPSAPWSGGLGLDQHALGNYLSGAALEAVSAVTAGRYSRVPVRRPR